MIGCDTHKKKVRKRKGSKNRITGKTKRNKTNIKKKKEEKEIIKSRWNFIPWKRIRF